MDRPNYLNLQYLVKTELVVYALSLKITIKHFCGKFPNEIYKDFQCVQLVLLKLADHLHVYNIYFAENIV
jgi:hypothetical protein